MEIQTVSPREKGRGGFSVSEGPADGLAPGFPRALCRNWSHLGCFSINELFSYAQSCSCRMLRLHSTGDGGVLEPLRLCCRGWRWPTSPPPAAPGLRVSEFTSVTTHPGKRRPRPHTRPGLAQYMPMDLASNSFQGCCFGSSPTSAC